MHLDTTKTTHNTVMSGNNDNRVPSDGTEGDNLFPGAEGPGMTLNPASTTEPSSTEPASAKPETTSPESQSQPQPAADSQDKPAVPHHLANCVRKGDKWVHEPSGFEFTNESDAPGYKWKNKRAQEEEARAWDFVADLDPVAGGVSLSRLFFVSLSSLLVRDWLTGLL